MWHCVYKSVYSLQHLLCWQKMWNIIDSIYAQLMKDFIFAVLAPRGTDFSKWKAIVAQERVQFTLVATAVAVYIK